MDPEFARQYYESAAVDHWWFQGRRQLVARLLENYGIASGRFVDLGAGGESLFPSGIKTIKLDLVRPEMVTGNFVQASAELLPFADDSFDGVGLFDVLEHLADPGMCLFEAARIVRPGGAIVVTVPAYNWLWSPHDDLVGHVRRYSPSDLRASLESSGVRLLWSSAFYGFLLPPAILRAFLSLESPMSLPSSKVNAALGRLSRRSIRRALRRPRALGLSLAAIAAVDSEPIGPES